MGGASGGAAKEDTIPKPDGLAEAAATANPNRDRDYTGGATHFQHKDWLGTERIRTTYNGTVEGRFTQLAFGDGYTVSGTDTDDAHYASLDYDAATQSSHAQFRELDLIHGRWFSPDPYDGSYDLSNPQSFNRYNYALNNPVAAVDPSGLDLCDEDGDSSLYDDPCGGDDGGGGGGGGGDGGGGDGGGGIIDPSAGGSTTVYGDPPPDPNPCDTFDCFAGGSSTPGPTGGVPGGAPSNGQPDNKSCASRLAAGVQKNTGATPTNLQYTGTVGGHANYTFDVSDPTGFQGILNQNPAWPLPFGLDQGSRYGVIQSTHIENTVTGGFTGHTDLFNGHSFLAPLHWIVDVGIGHIPGVNLDFGCKAGS